MPILISLLPVIIFLLVLNSLDTFKLLKPAVIISVILWGFLSALLAYPINSFFFSVLDEKIVSGITAPLIEETLKFAAVSFLFYRNKLGFLADALIIGFASGAGFSIIENIYYLNQLDSQNIMLWVVRGLGTAIMHGTATAIAAVVAQNLISRKENVRIHFLLIGLAAGFVIHAVFNNFFLSPLLQTVLQISLLPLIVIQIFTSSEKSLRNWMEEQSQSEFELLRMIKKGDFKSTRAGKYVLSIKNRFDPEVILDMLAYTQLHLELSIKANGLLLMKETGFDPKKEVELESMLSELNFLSKSIGKTGLRTLMPVINMKNKDLWKLNLLK
jgi:RsiW-degrading membrane proteinase PrsW (M82 family)